MKAVTRDRYGPPEVLRVEELETPTPTDRQILIRVHATTVNRTDTGILTATPFVLRFFTGLRKPSSRIPGTDFAGEVTAVGANVSRFTIGDRVWGFYDEGLASQAQYMTIEEDAPVTLIPDGITYDEAAASIEGAHYAINFINKVDIKPGNRVLINGASGAIGSAMFQLVQQKNAVITAVVNSQNVDRFGEMGANRVIDFEQQDFTQNAEHYKFIFDAVGKSTFGACKHMLTPDGVYISSELGPRLQNTYLPLITKFRGGKKVLFPFPSDIPKSLEIMSEALQQDFFTPVIDRTYPMDQIREAYEYVLSGQKTGNVLIHYD
jgi:NADPH:quinone reductase-like Zn-dependent oxidoreductase